MLIVAGDACYDDKEEVETFLHWMGSQQHRNKIYVPGNVDGRPFEYDPAAMAKVCDRHGIILLNDSDVEINRRTFWGSPITPRYGNMAFNRDQGEDIDRHWKLIPDHVDVLITHGPPLGILDQVDPSANSNHVGCPELMKRIREVKPKICVFGHIHGGYGNLESDGTRFFNVAICTEKFRPTNPITEIDLGKEEQDGRT